jgi:hypothetical protein
MRNLLFLVSMLAGALTGLALTHFAVDAGARFLVSRIQNWEFSPRIGAAEIDPYTRARLFFEGELPLASGEGFALRARFDAEGLPLDRRCRYRLAAPMPPARFWSVTLTDPAGRLVPNLAERHGFTSGEIVRAHDGRFEIAIGPEAAAGNWLPTGGEAGTFELILRFYETPLAATATRLDPRVLPVLTKTDCAS